MKLLFSLHTRSHSWNHFCYASVSFLCWKLMNQLYGRFWEKKQRHRQRFFYNTEFVSLIVARPIDNNGEKRFNCTEFVHLGFFSWGRFLCPPEANSILCLVIFRDRRWNLSVFFLFVLCIFVVDDFVTILFHIPQRVCQLASVKNLHFSLYFIQNILWQILWFSVILSLLIFIFFFSFVIFFIIFCILRDIVSYTSIHRFIQSKPESFGNFLPLNGQSQHSLDKHTSNT